MPLSSPPEGPEGELGVLGPFGDFDFSGSQGGGCEFCSLTLAKHGALGVFWGTSRHCPACANPPGGRSFCPSALQWADTDRKITSNHHQGGPGTFGEKSFFDPPRRLLRQEGALCPKMMFLDVFLAKKCLFREGFGHQLT